MTFKSSNLPERKFGHCGRFKGLYKRKQVDAICLLGLAPVQISYLGYPGTLGTNFIHYIVADKIIIPADQREYYSEDMIYLPNTYQPTDNKRKISNVKLRREDFNLPSDGFVFCCFNSNYKISRTEFRIWMRLLKKIEGSVLIFLGPTNGQKKI